jgi:hypothetical protein
MRFVTYKINTHAHVLSNKPYIYIHVRTRIYLIKMCAAHFLNIYNFFFEIKFNSLA